MNVWNRMIAASVIALGLQVGVSAGDGKPATYTFKHKGNDRVYSVFLPKDFDPDTTIGHWSLCMVGEAGTRRIRQPSPCAESPTQSTCPRF